MISGIDIRPGDGKPVIAAFTALVGISAAYGLLETARDTLFLSRLPAAQLPWAYLGIAALVLILMRLLGRTAVRDERLFLFVLLVGSAAGTAAFFPLAGADLRFVPMALYLWTGVISTLLYPRFWLLLGLVLPPAQARRLFPIVGSGALVGATLGSLAANGLLHFMPARGLLLAAAAILLVTAGLVAAAGKPAGMPEAPAPREPLGSSARVLSSHVYARRMLLLALVTMMTVTVVDYFFKSAVAVAIPEAELGRFLAKTYAILSAIALIIQLFLAPWLVTRFGVVAALVALPIAIVAAATAYLVSGALTAVLVLKLADGAFRNSLSRVGSELLLLPISVPVRERLKPIIETAGTRGGQAIAAFIILAALALGAGPVHLDVAALSLAVLWLIAILGLRERYLDLYRGALREGRVHVARLPRPDLPMIETLVAALSSRHDEEVVAAMELLARADKPHLIPAPMVYHSSLAVVRRALELMAAAGRAQEIAASSERLVAHRDPAIRSLGIAYAPPERAAAALDDANLLVRGAAAVAILARQPDDARARASFDGLLGGPSVEGARALARAIADQRDPRLLPLLHEIALDRRPGVGAELARAARALPSPELLPRLTEMLADRDSRDPARRAIRAIGPRALDDLALALADEGLPSEVRHGLPRTISQFKNPRAAAILVGRLETEREGAVLYRLLRELTRMKSAAPHFLGGVDPRPLERLVDRTVRRVVDVVGWRVALESDPRPPSPARTLVEQLLVEKERHTLERVFLLLGLIDPRAGYELVYTGIRSHDGIRRDAALEIIGNVLEPPRRDLVLLLVDDLPDRERLRRAQTPVPALDKALAEMAADHSPALRALVEYMVADQPSRSAG